ncbi:uncharacterized protein VTP21DRAFT_10366 [Calcarisporiella thermophila]|uniref:uncharacterized protein n=1 Tax=Calcarisporiella thermophila TaxID=911321 RepID=UPI003742E79E
MLKSLAVFALLLQLAVAAPLLNTTIGTDRNTMVDTCNADVTTMDAKKYFGQQMDLGVNWHVSLPYDKWIPGGPEIPIIVDGGKNKFNHLVIIATTLSLEHIGVWKVPNEGFATVDSCQGENIGAALVTTTNNPIGPQLELRWQPPSKSGLGPIQFFSCVAASEPVRGYQCYSSDGIEEQD